MSQSPKCPKCDAGMHEGFILDRSYDRQRIALWIAGRPEKSVFLENVKIAGKEQYEIQCFRCPACGFLESYANKSSAETPYPDPPSVPPPTSPCIPSPKSKPHKP